MKTADNLTDDEIRKLCGPGCDRALRRLGEIALNDAPTYLRADVVRDARERLAKMLNERAQLRAAVKPFFPIKGPK